MTPPSWDRVAELFDAASELPAAEREAFLQSECQSDAALRAEVETLLGAAERAPARLQAAIGSEAQDLITATSSMSGRRLGPYRVVDEIGAGGMGAVYLAVRDDDQYRTQVAIKVLQRGLETADAVARFRDERQILATLEHPNIVRLLDGGTSDDGRPYLVMERIEGVAITRYAEEKALSVRARVELLRVVCAAVQLAHQRLVVHRDLKPSNILVTADGTAKLLDFGIAKLLDPALGPGQPTGGEAHTRTGMQLFTPEYASPEQARGDPASTTTDIYSLGAVLYHLLAGRPPHVLEGDSLNALRVILEVDPPRPSAVAPAARRRALTGDLDNIVLKALRKEPARRYASVEQLADDLRRYLEGLPVEARAGNRSYRLGKFLRRNRVLVSAATLVMLSLATATVVSLREARRADAAAEEARRSFDDVRHLANSLLFEVDGAIRDLEGATGARELIVKRALEYLDHLAQRAQGDDGLARELASAYIKIGDIQANNRMANLGQPREGLASFEKAIATLDGLPRTEPATRWLLAQANFGMAAAYMMEGEAPHARERATQATALVDTLPAGFAFDDERVEQGYELLVYLDGDVAGDMAAARRNAEAGLELAERWSQRDASAAPRYWIALFRAMRAFAEAQVGDPESALVDLGQTRQIVDALLAAQPANASYRWLDGATLVQIAKYDSGTAEGEIWNPSVGDRAAAEDILRLALAQDERLTAHDARDDHGHALLATETESLGGDLIDHDLPAAIAELEKARTEFAALPREAYVLDLEYFTHCALAEALARAGRGAEARAESQAGLAMVQGPTFAERLHLQSCRYLVARADQALGDRSAAIDLLQHAVTDVGALLVERPGHIRLYLGLSDIYELLAELQPEQRCPHFVHAAATLHSWPGAATPFSQRVQARMDAMVASCR